MEEEQFIPIITLGLLKSLEDPEVCHPAAQSYNAMDAVKFNPEAGAGFLVSTVECLINAIPESEQIEFEKKMLRLFNKKVKIREQIMESVDNEAQG